MPKEKTSKEPSKVRKNTVPKPEDSAATIQRKKNIRLSIGFIITLIGAVCTVAIISYCFNWKLDQNNLISNLSYFDFLFVDKTPVVNWGGRLGAAISHFLVYRTVGIVAVIFTLWVMAKGINMLYGSTYIRTSKWLRWMALSFLFVSPLLAFVFADSPFPFGGALGTSVVEWTQDFAGKIGTILVLLTVAAIFAFIVFNLDIKPLLKKAKTIAKQSMESPDKESDELLNESEPEAYIFQSTGATHPDVEDVPLSNEYQPNTLLKESVPKKIEDPMTLNDVLGMQLVEIEEAAALVAEEDDDEADFLIDEPDEIDLEFPDHLIISPMPDQAQISPLAHGALHLELPEIEETASVPATKTYDPTALEIIPSSQEEPVADDFVITTVTEETVSANEVGTVTGNMEPYDPSLELSRYKYPTLDLLEQFAQNDISFDREELERNKNQIIATLRSFGIEIQRISATVGPTVTLYEIVPAEGVRISKIRNLEDDIALSLSALGIRMIAPIPGKGTIGIEVPNANKQIVSMRALLESEKFVNSKMSLPIALGKKIDNENYIVDLATMPHLLMAGATGQGKSVGINAILVSLLYKKHPSQLKFVMVDPKKVELSIYKLIEKHFLAKLPNEEEAIITDTKKVINTLNALCIEMDNRYELLKDAGARNIKEYNDKFIRRKLNPQDGHKFLPFIVLVIDEFADLIMTAGKEVEMPIARLAQLARAIGIHLIVATQRPSVNVITGIIKANFPARMAFRVSSKIDSRTILDAGGADQLIGRGDMLVSHGSEMIRLQCAFVDTPEVERIVEFIGKQQGYPTAFELPEYEGAENEGIEEKNIDLSRRDKMFEDCAYMIVNSQSGSTSMLQRKFNLGYNRAGRIMDQMEAAGIVGSAQGSKPRDVLVKTEYELKGILEALL
ncbi:MAG: DNA translocase FtsK [Sphingobacteriales bacterium]|nr:MAG: DNA translocase FtsK [Sphingobacteriales bacterium]